MVLHIPINELTSLAKEKGGKDINLHIVDDHTINVGYDITKNILFLGNISKNVNLDVVIEKICENDLYLRYSTKILGGDTIVGALLSIVPLFSSDDVVNKGTDGEVIVHLDKIDKIRDFVCKINLNSISFCADKVLVDFAVK